MCSLQNERLFDIPVMKTASFAMKRVNSDGKCYKAEVSGKEGQIDRMPFLMKIWGTPTLHPLSPLLKIWKQIVQHFLNIFQKIAFVLSVSLEEFQFLIAHLPSLHTHKLLVLKRHVIASPLMLELL